MSETVRLRTSRRSPGRGGPARRGVTLLELILALGLSILVLGAVALAINVFLRQLDARRSQVEETQIARAVLRMIADDLRSAVQQEKLDFSQVSGSASTLASSAAAAAVDSATGSSSGTGGSTGSTTGGGSSSGTGTGGGAGGAAGGSGNSGSGSGGSSTSGGSSASGGSSTSGGSSSSGTSGSGSTSTATQDIEQATETPPVPGIFGNQYQLMIDVSRLPRIDELTMQSSSGGTNVEDLPSDIKTVAYYVRQEEAQMSTGFTSAAPGSALGRELRRPGLVRRQLDRAVTMYATQGGNTTNLQSKEQLVAPEIVGVEFRYFDGTQWLTSWDSIEQNRLPSAVEIIVAVQPGGEQFLPQSSSAATANPTVSPSSGATTGPLMFRQIVKIPAARACAAAGSATSTDSSATSDDASSSSSGSSGTNGSGTSGSAGSGAGSGS